MSLFLKLLDHDGKEVWVKIRSVQNFTEANPTNWHQQHRPNYSADWMSRGQHSDFALCSNAGAVKSSNWEIRNRDCGRTKPIQNLSFWFFFFFYEANKTTSYVWVLLKKTKTKTKQKQKQNDAFYDRFSDSQGYKFIFFSQNLLTLSLTLASRVSLDIAPRLSSRRRYASPKLSPSLTDHSKTTVSFFVFSVLFVFEFYCFFLFICLGKLKAWMIKYLSWFECLIKFGCLGKHDLYVKC